AVEALVLPGRVPGYSPALLDELSSAGEVVWAGAGTVGTGDGWLVLAPAESAPLLPPEPGELTMPPLPARARAPRRPPCPGCSTPGRPAGERAATAAAGRAVTAAATAAGPGGRRCRR